MDMTTIDQHPVFFTQSFSGFSAEPLELAAVAFSEAAL